MSHAPNFFYRAPPLSLARLVEMAGIEMPAPAPGNVVINDVAALDRAGEGALVFLDNAQYLDDLGSTKATACLIKPRYASRVPAHVVALQTPQPYEAYARVAGYFYPGALRDPGAYETHEPGPPGQSGEHNRPDEQGTVHPSARLEPGVIVEPGAVIGAKAAIGSGTIICAGAVIGAQVHIGRDCRIGPNAVIRYGLLGDGVIIHSGACIGQDGFGFALGADGHAKVPQFGRVVIQDKVEIGASTCIDRGANRDTIIGEGSKIDNLVQIGHNVEIGRHCVIVAQSGISGSTVLEDFVALGGQVGIVGHVRIGAGAQVAASSGVSGDIPPQERWGGTPARSLRAWLREVAVLKRLALARRSSD